MKKLIENRVVYAIPTGAHKTIYYEDDFIKPLVDLGAEVWVMPTEMAKGIIPEYEKFKMQYKVKDNFSSQKNWLVPEEEVVVVAPCTFNTFNKIANGIADNYPLSIVHNAIGKGVKIILAPAMDFSLWNNFTMKRSLESLQNQPNIYVVYPEFFYNEAGKLVKISMAPYSKILDAVIREFITIKYDHQKVEGNIDELRREYFPEFKKYGEIFKKEGFNPGKAGFFALRIPEGIITTATSTEVGKLNFEDLTLVVKVEDKKVFWKGDKAPTSEFPLVYEIFSEFEENLIVHGHCKSITYNPSKVQYMTSNYMSYGVWNEIDVIREKLIMFEGVAIMRLHGEIILCNSFEDALKKYKEMRL